MRLGQLGPMLQAFTSADLSYFLTKSLTKHMNQYSRIEPLQRIQNHPDAVAGDGILIKYNLI